MQNGPDQGLNAAIGVAPRFRWFARSAGTTSDGTDREHKPPLTSTSFDDCERLHI